MRKIIVGVLIAVFGLTVLPVNTASAAGLGNHPKAVKLHHKHKHHRHHHHKK